MNAQFVNNTSRFALYVIVERIQTLKLSGFIFLIGKNTAQNLITAIESCIKYIKMQFNWSSKFCIDKDASVLPLRISCLSHNFEKFIKIWRISERYY